MNRYKFMPSGIFTFIFSIVALVASFVLYIYWYIEISSGLEEVIQKFHIDPGLVFESQTAMVIVVLALLAGLMLAGLSMTFVYNQKMQQLYRLQNNFINNFTHELKTPVTSLKLYLETFLKHDLSKEDQEKYLNYMLRDVHRLSDNISNILDLGRIESHHFQGELVVVDAASFISKFYLNNAYLFQGLDIQVEASSNECSAAINPPLFEMLLINLATNALKYNESSVPVFKISFESRTRHLAIIFSDNGIGIAPSESKKIFKKFYQVGHSQTRSAQGSGLGLYLVQSIVKAHRGKISLSRREADNKITVGSTFSLVLPHPKNRHDSKVDSE